MLRNSTSHCRYTLCVDIRLNSPSYFQKAWSNVGNNPKRAQEKWKQKESILQENLLLIINKIFRQINTIQKNRRRGYFYEILEEDRGGIII